MTMRFGQLMCIRCSMPGHLSHACVRPILPPLPPDDELTTPSEEGTISPPQPRSTP